MIVLVSKRAQLRCRLHITVITIINVPCSLSLNSHIYRTIWWLMLPAPIHDLVQLTLILVSWTWIKLIISFKLQCQVRTSASVTQVHRASITDAGYMYPQTSTGIIHCHSTNLRYEHQTLTFHHQCLSTFYNSLPSGSWIIDNGATTHVCSDLTRFNDLSPMVGVTVSLLLDPISVSM